MIKMIITKELLILIYKLYKRHYHVGLALIEKHANATYQGEI